MIPPFNSTPDRINDGEHHDVTPFDGCKTGGKVSPMGSLSCSGSCCCCCWTGVGSVVEGAVVVDSVVVVIVVVVVEVVCFGWW